MIDGWFLAWLTARHVGRERNIPAKRQLALTWRRGVLFQRTPLFELTLPLLSEVKKRSACRRLLNRNISSRSISKRVSVYSTDSKQKSNAQTQFICHLRPFCLARVAVNKGRWTVGLCSSDGYRSQTYLSFMQRQITPQLLTMCIQQTKLNPVASVW
jgi:hypothetical protein